MRINLGAAKVSVLGSLLTAALAGGQLTGCTVGEPAEDEEATAGTSINNGIASLTGCQGKASSSIPTSGLYRMTTFGGPSEYQPMSCGGNTRNYTYYAASRQRYGCGAKLKLEANGKCVVVEALDYGADVCVERAAGMPVMDVSPAAGRLLWSDPELGWSDRKNVTVTKVAKTTRVGPCSTEVPPAPPPPEDDAPATPESDNPGTGGSSGSQASCQSDTMARNISHGECVQAASDAKWYRCADGAWQGSSASDSACTARYGFCNSATLGRPVAPRTCVQARSDQEWYQCNGSGWASPASETEGPLGACASSHPL